jgi:hypothetical protein
MQLPGTSLLFSVALLAQSALSFAETTAGASSVGAQREPYVLILLGAVFIGGAIFLRHIKTPKRKDPLSQSPKRRPIAPAHQSH